MQKLKVGIIGCGYWGTHLIRNFISSPNWEVVGICDINTSQLDKQKSLYSWLNIFTDYNLLLSDTSIDAIVIATPVFSHYEIAVKSLNAGKHVWVEKPLTFTAEQSEVLVKLADDKKLILNVDHTFIYTPAVKKMKEIIDSGELGEILYFDSVRVNLGLFQHDVNVIWDLAPHDISILAYCLDKKPISVNAVGKCLVRYNEKEHENIAYMTVNFDDRTIAHFHVNWLSPIKIRKIIIGGTKKMLVFDDMQPTEKIKVYDSGVNLKSKDDIYETLIQYRTGDMYSPAVSNKEALREEVDHFHECINNQINTITPGESGLYVVKILEAANESLKNGGKLVNI